MSKRNKIVIVDYGLGNLYSLNKALRLFADNIVITDDPDTIIHAKALVIPGVGAFAVGMHEMRTRNLVQPLRDFAASGRPMLGICLGAQLMLTKGFEFGEHDGLGIIPGIVEIFPKAVTKKEKVPHIGWNGIYPPKKNQEWDSTIFAGVPSNSNVYFVHSYIMVPTEISSIIAFAEYGGLKFCAAIKKGNIYGAQFHPEKSGESGLTIMKNFISLSN